MQIKSTKTSLFFSAIKDKTLDVNSCIERNQSTSLTIHYFVETVPSTPVCIAMKQSRDAEFLIAIIRIVFKLGDMYEKFEEPGEGDERKKFF